MGYGKTNSSGKSKNSCWWYSSSNYGNCGNGWITETVSPTSYGSQFSAATSGTTAISKFTLTWDASEVERLLNKYLQYDKWFCIWQTQHQEVPKNTTRMCLKIFPCIKVMDGETILLDNVGGVGIVWYNFETQKFEFSYGTISSWVTSGFDTYISWNRYNYTELSSNTLVVYASTQWKLNDMWTFTEWGYGDSTKALYPFVGMRCYNVNEYSDKKVTIPYTDTNHFRNEVADSDATFNLCTMTEETTEQTVSGNCILNLGFYSTPTLRFGYHNPTGVIYRYAWVATRCFWFKSFTNGMPTSTRNVMYTHNPTFCEHYQDYQVADFDN